MENTEEIMSIILEEVRAVRQDVRDLRTCMEVRDKDIAQNRQEIVLTKKDYEFLHDKVVKIDDRLKEVEDNTEKNKRWIDDRKSQYTVFVGIIAILWAVWSHYN